jgi:DNA-binding transcriptional ArsR family regulator
MKVLSDQTRFSIVHMLLSRDYCVGGLARMLDISEAAVSQHLRLLNEVGIVSGEKKGYFKHYQVERSVISNLAGALLNLVGTERTVLGECHPRARETCKLCNAEHHVEKQNSNNKYTLGRHEE